MQTDEPQEQVERKPKKKTKRAKKMSRQDQLKAQNKARDYELFL